VCNYFYEAMPEGTVVEQVERWESQAAFMPFVAHRQAVVDELGWASEDVELWLFHGTDAVDAVLENGFRISHANHSVKHNRYGIGVYFARDPRLAHFFVQGRRNEPPREMCQLILARVVVGSCARRPPIRQQEDLLRPEHRGPPVGYHSCTSGACAGREIIVFPGSPGTPAYPAYVISYRCALQNNPYRDSELMRVDFDSRWDANVFDRYRRLNRAARPLDDNPQEPAKNVPVSASQDSAGLPVRRNAGQCRGAACEARATSPDRARSRAESDSLSREQASSPDHARGRARAGSSSREKDPPHQANAGPPCAVWAINLVEAGAYIDGCLAAPVSRHCALDEEVFYGSGTLAASTGHGRVLDETSACRSSAPDEASACRIGTSAPSNGQGHVLDGTSASRNSISAAPNGRSRVLDEAGTCRGGTVAASTTPRRAPVEANACKAGTLAAPVTVLPSDSSQEHAESGRQSREGSLADFSGSAQACAATSLPVVLGSDLPARASAASASSLTASPAPASPAASPVMASPVAASPVAASPLAASPVTASPVAALPVAASPVFAMWPTSVTSHNNVDEASAGSHTAALPAVAFIDEKVVASQSSTGSGTGVLDGTPMSTGSARRRSGAVRGVSPGGLAEAGVWRIVEPLPVAASRLAVADLGGLIFAIGGSDGHGASLATVQCLSHRTRSWASFPSLSAERQGHVAASLNGTIYALGGRGSSSGCTSLSSVEVFDPGGGGVWSEFTPLPSARSFAAATVLDGALYVVGGLASRDRRIAALDRLDPREGTWVSLAPMLSPRSGLAATAVDGTFYVLGGTDSNGLSPRLERYHPRINAWDTDLPAQSPIRSGLAAVANGGFLYSIGGRRSAVVSTVERLNVRPLAGGGSPRVPNPTATQVSQGHIWTTTAPLAMARSNLAAAVHEDCIYAVGGSGDGPGRLALNIVERFEPRGRM